MSLAVNTRLGPYEVVELLGRGGMGEVYRARDPRLGRDVAVKVLPADVAQHPQRLHRFEREARAVAALNHPNVLSIFDVGSSDGTTYLVTELLEGQTLREHMLGPAPSVKRALGLALQVARGLEAAHAKGVVHRDIKPENILVTPDGHVKILDFGLAKLLAGADGPGAQTTGAEVSHPGEIAGTLSYMAPEQARGRAVDARADVFSLGVVLYELLSGHHPFRRDSAAATLEAILGEEPEALARTAAGLTPAVSTLVQRCLSKDPGERYATGHDLAVSLETVLAVPSGPGPVEGAGERCPYPGLESYTENDAGVFFGREQEVEALWSRLHQRRLLALIGASGAGKTSFVRAGVVAHRPEGWSALVVRPGAAPATGLARALATEVAGDPEAVQRLLRFDEPDVVVGTLSSWRRGYREALLVVDQFEELFTLNPPETQAAYAALLGRLAEEADLHVLLSLRDDFLIRCGEHPSLRDVFESLMPLLPLDREALRRVLVEPARIRGVSFADEALVEAMAEAVEGERGALPLLAFAMARLWETRDPGRRILTREAYEAMGGVAGALARHAEATLERIGPERQPLVREIFRHLVTAQGTRAVVDRDDLLSAFPDREAAEEALQRLVGARLLTSYELEATDDAPAHHRVEIVHESLLVGWPRLVRWQTQDADGAVLHDQLRQAAHLWDDKGRTPELLWSGTAFREFELWRGRYPGTLTALEQDYARAMVERARRRKRLRTGAVAAAFALLIAVASAIAVSREQTAAARDEARAEALRAEAGKVLVLAQSRIEADPTEALALATASLELVDTEAARVASLRALSEAPPATELSLSRPDLSVPAFSPDGRYLAIAGNATEVHVFPSDGAAPLVLRGRPVSPNAPNVPVWASPEVLVAGLTNGIASDVALWSLPGGQELRRVDFGGPTWWHLGRDLLLGEARVPDPETGREVYQLRAWALHDGTVRQLGSVDWQQLGTSSSFLTPDAKNWMYSRGRTVYLRPLPVTAGVQDRVLHTHEGEASIAYSRNPVSRITFGTQDDFREWVFEGGMPMLARRIRRPETAPPFLRLDHSSRWLAVRPLQTDSVQAWSTAWLAGARPIRLRRSGSWYMSNYDFHPEDRWLVVTTHGGETATFWPLHEPQPSVVEGYAMLRRPVAFSPDGCRLATSWADRTVRLWTLPGCGTPGVETLSGLPAALWTELAFDPSGRRLFAVANAGVVFTVPLDGGRPRRLEGFPGGVLLEGGAVSPSGRWGAAAWGFGEGERTLRVWSLSTGESRAFDLPDPQRDPGEAPSDPPQESGYSRGVYTISFVDDSTLLTGGDGGVRRWNLAEGTSELLYGTGPGVSTVMAADREGVRAVVLPRSQAEFSRCDPTSWVDLRRGTSHVLTEFGDCVSVVAIDGSGTVIATGDASGVVRVGRPGGEPHLLLGHEGVVGGVLDGLAISPDLHWVASAGEDNTLRLWPMPDLDAPPLHTLPHQELVAKLKSLTNLRAVRDPEAPDGWRIELAPFPGWKEVPTW